MESNALIMLRKELDGNLRDDTVWPILPDQVKQGRGSLCGLLTATQPQEEMGGKGLEMKSADLQFSSFPTILCDFSNSDFEKLKWLSISF